MLDALYHIFIVLLEFGGSPVDAWSIHLNKWYVTDMLWYVMMKHDVDQTAMLSIFQDFVKLDI